MSPKRNIVGSFGHCALSLSLPPSLSFPPYLSLSLCICSLLEILKNAVLSQNRLCE